MRLPGHPDAACDQVVEAIVDEYLRRDPDSRVQISAQGGHGALFVTGQVLSQADFDVAAVAKRALAQAGVMSDIEPFVSVEPVAPEQRTHVQIGSALPQTVVGYATNETPEGIPQALVHARRIARALDDRRANDEAWFWIGADGEVSVLSPQGKPPLVHLRIEHGDKTVSDARAELTSFVHSLLPDAEVQVNLNGADQVRGLAHTSGASGRDVQPYGQGLPAIRATSGLDPHDVSKAGTWLARAAALQALRASGAKAALLQATYLPGNGAPSVISVRDERGRDLSTHVSTESMAIERVAKEWWRPGLNLDAARWGFAGMSGLPWEEGR